MAEGARRLRRPAGSSGHEPSSTATAGSRRTSCSLPGLVWLALFFLVPLGFLGYQSLQSGDVRHRATRSPGRSRTTGTRSATTTSSSSARSSTPGIATRARAAASRYPLVYWIAFRGGRWKNLFLLLIIAPFFVTYLVRTLAWLNILADDGPVVGILRDLHVLGAGDGRLLATSVAVVAGITYNFLPFMALPLYVSLEQIDPRLLEAAEDLYASKLQAFLRVTLPLSLPGHRRRHAAHVHPGGRRLHQRPAARHAAPVHDRQRHPVEVPRADRLPGGGGALVHPDGADPRRAPRLRAVSGRRADG